MKSTAVSTDKTIAQLQSKIVDLETKVRFYEEQFNLLQHKRFGRSSEKPDTQAELFNEAESIITEEEHTHHDDTEADSAQITITYTRKKPGRKPLPKDLRARLRDSVRVQFSKETTQLRQLRIRKWSRDYCCCSFPQLKALGVTRYMQLYTDQCILQGKGTV